MVYDLFSFQDYILCLQKENCRQWKPTLNCCVFSNTALSSPQVVYNVGLCICLYDITKLDDSYIFPGDGAAHTKGAMMA